MTAKFKIGDKVVVKRMNKRTPLYVREAIRIDRARTIKSVFYDKGIRHNQYHLGSNQSGVDITGYSFRAQELRLATKHIGRPRQKRKYGRGS